jgi:hypothetical protein
MIHFVILELLTSKMGKRITFRQTWFFEGPFLGHKGSNFDQGRICAAFIPAEISKSSKKTRNSQEIASSFAFSLNLFNRSR